MNLNAAVPVQESSTTVKNAEPTENEVTANNQVQNNPQPIVNNQQVENISQPQIQNQQVAPQVIAPQAPVNQPAVQTNPKPIVEEEMIQPKMNEIRSQALNNIQNANPTQTVFVDTL